MTRVAKLKVDDFSAPARNAAPSNLGISISSASRVGRLPVELDDDWSRILVSPTIAASSSLDLAEYMHDVGTAYHASGLIEFRNVMNFFKKN